MKENFSEINENEEFQKIYNKENKINCDFHGNRDFYYLIKGVANEINNNDNIGKDGEKVTEIIENYIERNFGGMDIDVDIDTDMVFYSTSFTNIKKIMKNINSKHKKKIISSVEFIKIIYNICCKKEPIKKNISNIEIKNV